VNSNLSSFAVSDDSGGNSANFSLIEKAQRHLMNTIDFKRVRVVAGVRLKERI